MKRIFLLAFLFVALLSGSVQAQGYPSYYWGYLGNVEENITMQDGYAVEIATGSLANLGFRFRSDADTGFYEGLANSFWTVAGGISILNYTNAGTNIYRPLSNPYSGGAYMFGGSGTATSTTPQYAFYGATTTGLGAKTVGEMSAYATAVEAMRFTNIGCYLASTTAPASETAILSRKEIEDKVAAAAAGNSILYYIHETNSPGFSGYESLTLVGTTTVSQDSAVGLTTANKLIDKWVTATGSPNITMLRNGRYDVHCSIWKDTGADAIVTYGLYTITTGGVETHVASSTAYTITNDNATSTLDVSIIVSVPVPMSATDMLTLKLSGLTPSSTTNIRMQYGGAFQATFNAPIDSGVFMRIDASNASLPTVRTNLDVYSKSETIALTGGGAYVGDVTAAFAADTASFTLPTNAATTIFPLADDKVWYVDAWVQAKLVASSEAILFKIHTPICSNGGAPFVFGASTTVRDEWMNGVGAGSRYDCFLSVGNPGFAVIASGPVNSIWKVVKLEVGGL